MVSREATSMSHSHNVLDHCDTVLLDMDGTLLDLAFDNYIWLQRVPQEYAALQGISEQQARDQLYTLYASFSGKLEWYCLDHWTERLGLDLLELHRQLHARIAWLPGAKRFLESCQQRRLRLLLVTNSHPDTLAIKAGVTGIDKYFDHVCSSHELGYPKEEQAFWHALREREQFDPAQSLFVDDSLAVLRSAQLYGLRNIRVVTRPDTSQPQREPVEFTGVDSVLELLG